MLKTITCDNLVEIKNKEQFTVSCINKSNDKIKKLSMYYLIYEQETALSDIKRFMSDQARIASTLNSFRNNPFYTHLASLFVKKVSKYILYKLRNLRQKFCDNARVSMFNSLCFVMRQFIPDVWTKYKISCG